MYLLYSSSFILYSCALATCCLLRLPAFFVCLVDWFGARVAGITASINFPDGE